MSEERKGIDELTDEELGGSALPEEAAHEEGAVEKGGPEEESSSDAKADRSHLSAALDERPSAHTIDEKFRQNRMTRRQYAQKLEAERIARERFEQEAEEYRRMNDLLLQRQQERPKFLDDPDAAIQAALDERLGPILGSLQQMAGSQQERQYIEEVRARNEAYLQEITRLEAEYEATKEGEGFKDRFQRYVDHQQKLYAEAGHDPTSAAQLVAQDIDTVLKRGMATEGHPVFYLDRTLFSSLQAAPSGNGTPEVAERAKALSSSTAGSLGEAGRSTGGEVTGQVLARRAKVTAADLRAAISRRMKKEGLTWDDAQDRVYAEMFETG